MNVDGLLCKVLEHLRRSVREGEISQSGLARKLRLSQAHINNLLTGVRPLTADVADTVLNSFGLEVEDFLEPIPVSAVLPPQLKGKAAQPAVVVVRGDISPMPPAVLTGDQLLIDQASAKRRKPRWSRLYLVRVNGRQMVRRCQQVGRSLLVMAEAHGEPQDIPLAGRDLLGIVYGEVVWIGRTL